MAGKQDKGGIRIQVCVGKTMYPRIVGVEKERPVRTPDGNRVDFPRGFSSEPIRLGGGELKIPAGRLKPGGLVAWREQPDSDPRLSPRASLDRRGARTRGAPRGE